MGLESARMVKECMWGKHLIKLNTGQIISTFGDPLTRQIAESQGLKVSRSEYSRCRIPRLRIDMEVVKDMEIVKDMEEYRLKEMATNLLEEVVELVMEKSDIHGMVRLVTEYGPETRNKLEYELKRQRMEEMEAIRMIVKEGERELRLEHVETKRNAWTREYFYMQNNILIRSMKELDLKEVMVMEVDEECIQAKVEEDIVYMEPEE